MIQDRISKISDYFVSMNVNAEENVIYILVKFNKGWSCSELTEVNYNVNTTPAEQPYHFYFYSSIDVGFDKIFDAIDYNIKINHEAQEKVLLLRQKIEELKIIFENEDIKTLNTLEFKYKKKKNRENKTIPTDVNAEPVENNNGINEEE